MKGEESENISKTNIYSDCHGDDSVPYHCHYFDGVHEKS